MLRNVSIIRMDHDIYYEFIINKITNNLWQFLKVYSYGCGIYFDIDYMVKIFRHPHLYTTNVSARFVK